MQTKYIQRDDVTVQVGPSNGGIEVRLAAADALPEHLYLSAFARGAYHRPEPVFIPPDKHKRHHRAPVVVFAAI
jgi:hypothetical protein